MESIWNELYSAAKAVINPRNVSEFVEAGGVGAAIEAGSGKIYTGSALTAPAHWVSAPKETRFST